MMVELNKAEIDAILSSLQLLSKQNQVIMEDCLSISTNQLYNKLTSIQEQLYLKAKLSRLEQPNNPQYTDDELDAMTYENENQSS
jgi:hypothetical protein